jgi:Mrp family chromosome partitioning ATPase
MVAALGLAFLREALDTRVRTAEEISEYLETPLLGRVPEPPRDLQKRNQLVVLAQPAAPQAEALRMVRTNVEFTRREREAQTVLVTSPGMSEGKSTTIANLAVTAARAGLRVVLVDLDLRRPTLERLFRLEGRPGLTEVVTGRASLEEALAPISVIGRDPVRRRKRRGAAPGANEGTRFQDDQQPEGSLHVIPSGPLPPDAAEFLGKRGVGDVLDALRGRADLVLVDTTPLLVVGDAMTLTSCVDAVILVMRGKYVRRPMLKELGRVLAACPADTLGFVITGEPLPGDDYGYGGYRYGPKPYTRAATAATRS